MAIIKTLKTTTNDVEQSVYPKTVLEAVVDAETNETLDVILDNLNEKIDNIEPGEGGELPTDVQEQIDSKVSKSGDTMTGALEVSSSNYPPMTVTRSGQPYSAAIRFANSNGTLGAIGMTATGDELLRWSPDEQTIYTILDSGNYSAYAVPKTGGTFSGGVTFDSGVNVKGGFTSSSESTIFPQDYYVFHTADGAGKAGYWKLCSITITGTYAGAPIIFHMTSRAGNGTLGVNFSGATDISAYSVANIKLTDNINTCYIGKTSGTSSGSVFDIYVKKEEAYGNLTVTRIDFPRYMRDLVTLTWSGTYVASMPAGITWTSSAPSIPLYTNTYSSIPAATQSAVGLMSAADKKKLDGIATGANKITVDSSLSSTSTNPVQNKAVYASLVNRLPLSGGDMTGSICFADGKGIVDYAKQATVFTTSGTTVTPTSTIGTKRPVYVGTTNSSYVTYIRGSYVYVDSGSSNPVNTKSWQVISDQRIKTNSILLNDEDKYLTFFNNLKPRNYNYIRDEEGANKSIGFYAQEVEEALLSAGLTNRDFDGLNILEDFEYGIAHGKDESVYFKKFYTISYEQFIPIMVNKIQHMEKEFNSKIAELEAKIEELTGGTE